MEFFKRETNIDFCGSFATCLVASAVLIASGLTYTAYRGLNYGIDFAGGYEIQAKFDKAVPESTIRELIEPLGLGDARVQRYGPVEANEHLILFREHGSLTDAQKAELRGEMEALAGGADKLVNLAIAESGERVVVEFGQPVPEEQLRSVFAKYKIGVNSITRSPREDQPEYTVLTVSFADKIEQALRAGLQIPSEAKIIRRVEFVGPQVGAQLRTQGLLAVLASLFFMLIYVAVRFDLFFAPGALVSLVHDVLVMFCAYGILQLYFDLSAVAVLLTLVGYSINDTIVVYDRIRENLVKLRGRETRALVNASINQTLSRTILTGGSTILALLALIFFGGEVIKDFAIAMLVGLITGTYSSIFVATPFYVWLKERSDRRAAKLPSGREAAAV